MFLRLALSKLILIYLTSLNDNKFNVYKLARNDMDVNEHERLANITSRDKLK
jgi:hypothetical protein